MLPPRPRKELPSAGKAAEPPARFAGAGAGAASSLSAVSSGHAPRQRLGVQPDGTVADSPPMVKSMRSASMRTTSSAHTSDARAHSQRPAPASSTNAHRNKFGGKERSYRSRRLSHNSSMAEESGYSDDDSSVSRRRRSHGDRAAEGGVYVEVDGVAGFDSEDGLSSDDDPVERSHGAGAARGMGKVATIQDDSSSAHLYGPDSLRSPAKGAVGDVLDPLGFHAGLAERMHGDGDPAGEVGSIWSPRAIARAAGMAPRRTPDRSSVNRAVVWQEEQRAPASAPAASASTPEAAVSRGAVSAPGATPTGAPRNLSTPTLTTSRTVDSTMSDTQAGSTSRSGRRISSRAAAMEDAAHRRRHTPQHLSPAMRAAGSAGRQVPATMAERAAAVLRHFTPPRNRGKKNGPSPEAVASIGSAAVTGVEMDAFSPGVACEHPGLEAAKSPAVVARGSDRAASGAADALAAFRTPPSILRSRKRKRALNGASLTAPAGGSAGRNNPPRSAEQPRGQRPRLEGGTDAAPGGSSSATGQTMPVREAAELASMGSGMYGAVPSSLFNVGSEKAGATDHSRKAADRAQLMTPEKPKGTGSGGARRRSPYVVFSPSAFLSPEAGGLPMPPAAAEVSVPRTDLREMNRTPRKSKRRAPERSAPAAADASSSSDKEQHDERQFAAVTGKTATEHTTKKQAAKTARPLSKAHQEGSELLKRMIQQRQGAIFTTRGPKSNVITAAEGLLALSPQRPKRGARQVPGMSPAQAALSPRRAPVPEMRHVAPVYNAMPLGVVPVGRMTPGGGFTSSLRTPSRKTPLVLAPADGCAPSPVAFGGRIRSTPGRHVTPARGLGHDDDSHVDMLGDDDGSLFHDFANPTPARDLISSSAGDDALFPVGGVPEIGAIRSRAHPSAPAL